MHSPIKSLTARGLLNTFAGYLSWYDTIPDVLRLGDNFSPAVLFALVASPGVVLAEPQVRVGVGVNFCVR
jgi:hypothetical protein